MISDTSYPYPYRDEFKRRIQEILRQLEQKYEEIVHVRTQLDHLRKQGIQLCHEFHSIQSNIWRNASSNNADSLSSMSRLSIIDFQANIQELDNLIAARTRVYNKLVQEAYQTVSRLLSAINDCIRCES